MRDVARIWGQGVGPETIAAACRTVEATGVGISWVDLPMGSPASDPLPTATIDAIGSIGVCLKGPVETPLRMRSLNVTLRRELDLFAGVRPCKLYIGVPSLYESIDLVVIRENTEGMYTGIEFAMGQPATRELIGFIRDQTGREVRADSGISVKTISEFGSRRIVRFAMEYAIANARGKVTASHKANIMKFSDGLFLATARDVATNEFPQIGFDDRIIDALCMQLVLFPERFDVLVMPNLYGDVVSELGAGLIGGVGMAPGAHFGDGVAVFEATHGTAQRLAGANRANPVGAILSGAMLLKHLGEAEAANRVESAIAAVLSRGIGTADVSPDIRRAVGTSRLTDLVIEQLASPPSP
jgi:isocitrate dehydrogenase (NAD+)